MIAKAVLEEKPVGISEAKTVLDALSKSGNELNYEQRITMDYLSRFTRLSTKKSQKLIDELLNLNPKIKPKPKKTQLHQYK